MAWIYTGGLSDTAYTSGNTSAGWQPQNFAYGGHFVLASGGTVTQFGVKASQDSVGPYGLKFGLYDSSGNLIASSTGSVSSGSFVWNDSGTFSQAVSAGTYYLLVSAETTNVQYQYDASGNGSFATETYASFPANPETITGQGDTAQLYGVRMDYTAGASGNSQGATRRLLLGVG